MHLHVALGAPFSRPPRGKSTKGNLRGRTKIRLCLSPAKSSRTARPTSPPLWCRHHPASPHPPQSDSNCRRPQSSPRIARPQPRPGRKTRLSNRRGLAERLLYLAVLAHRPPTPGSGSAVSLAVAWPSSAEVRNEATELSNCDLKSCLYTISRSIYPGTRDPYRPNIFTGYMS